MKNFSKILIFVFVFIFGVAGLVPAAASEAQAEKIIDDIVRYNLKATASGSVQEWIDGYLTENAAEGTEWYVMALSNYGRYDFSAYKKALKDYLSANETGSASSRLKFALVLIATGERNSPFIKEFLENSVGEQGIMSLVFGLHILNNGYTCEKYSVKTLTEEILSFQSEDGGWSLTGKNGDVDVTAMTVQALSPQYQSNPLVRDAVDKAVDFLSARQNADGSFSTYGADNPESTAQVITALSSLGLDAEKDVRFIKNSKNLFDVLETYSSEDGAYSHQKGKETDSTATVQVFCAAVAFRKMKDDGSSFYIFSEKNNLKEETTQEEKTQATEPKPTETTSSEKTETVPSTEKTELTVSQTQAVAKVTEVVENKRSDFSYKLWIIAAIVLVSVCLCAVLLSKTRKKIYCIGVLVVAVCAILLVLFAIKPVEDSGKTADDKNINGAVTISITCETIKDKNNETVPENGVILEETEIIIDADDTVYDVLLKACRENDIHLETTGTDKTLYVEGICNIYEKDYGDLSGWMYFVNGESPSVGCGNYSLSDGDEIVWCYTCDLGEELNY